MASRSALAWSAIAVTFAVFALAALGEFSSAKFHLLLSLRLAACFIASILAFMNLGTITISRRHTIAIFVLVVISELAVAFTTTSLSPVILILGAIALGAMMNLKRDQRLAFETVGRGLKPAIRKHRDLVQELRDAAAKLKEALNPAQNAQLSQGENKVMFAHEGLPSTGLAVTKTNGPTLNLENITQVCASCVEAKRVKYLGKKRFHLVLNASRKFDIPVQVMIEGSDLGKIIGTCLDYSVNSLSGGEGLVRMAITTGLRQVSISIEDNGFGMSEERLSANDTDEKMTFAQMRGLAAFWGAKLVRNARLGVGSRVVIELPRVDAFVSEGRAHEVPLAKRSSDLELPLG